MCTTEEFIAKAEKVHGKGTYDYSESIYKGSSKTLKVKCNKCGHTFEPYAVNHLAGCGCTYCFGKQKLTLEQFIEKARKVHGYYYDYSKVIYVNSRTKITVICPIHGEFQVTANSHLMGFGCTLCTKDNLVKKEFEKFLEKAKAIHNNFYDYSSVIYKGSIEKVTIICPIHGPFQVTLNAHSQGSGCPICALESKTFTKEEFIRRAELVHGVGEYDYSEVVYKNKSKDNT